MHTKMLLGYYSMLMPTPNEFIQLNKNKMFIFSYTLKKRTCENNVQKYKFAKDYPLCLKRRWAFSPESIPRERESCPLLESSQKLSWHRKLDLMRCFSNPLDTFDLKFSIEPSLGSPVDWSVVQTCQGCEFSPPSEHIPC